MKHGHGSGCFIDFQMFEALSIYNYFVSTPSFICFSERMINMFYKEAKKMETRLFKWTLSVFILMTIFQSVQIVKADDDEYESHDKYQYEHDDDDNEEYDEYRGYDDDDEEYEEYEEYEQNDVRNQPLSQRILPSRWNTWTRDAIEGLNETLPFQDAKEVPIELNGKSELFFIVPQYGQLLVSGEKITNFIDAEFTFYEQSRILEVSKGNEELIVRVGTNAAFENKVKTPMPSKALYYEKSVYLPVSVIANSMGYRVSWNPEKETIVLQEIL